MELETFYEICPHGHWICKQCGHVNIKDREDRMKKHVKENHITQEKLKVKA